MKVASSFAMRQHADDGVVGAYARLVAKLGAPPQLLFLHASVRADAAAMLASLTAAAPQVSIHGGTSCVGVMTQDGFHRSDEGAVGMLGVLDPEGAYGVGVAELGNAPRAAATSAVASALHNAGRDGEVPDMIVAASSIDRAALDSRLVRIESTSQRIARVVRSLLTFSREADADAPAPALVQSLIDDTLELCRERFLKHGVELIVDQVPANLAISCRAPQISQVLLNLLINAFDAVANASPKWVRVTVRGLATGVEIAVTDSGPGIPHAI